MKKFLKYPFLLLFGLSMAGCGFMNNATDDYADEGLESVDEDLLDADDRFYRGNDENGGTIRGDEERPNGLG